MNYRNNGSIPKRPAPTIVPDDTPPAKRSKPQEDPDQGQCPDITEQDLIRQAKAIRSQMLAIRAARAEVGTATQPIAVEDFGEPDVVDNLPEPAPYTGWRPRVGAAEVNFRFDHTGMILPPAAETDLWTYSQSLKGWCRYCCIACGGLLDGDSVEVLLTHRGALPGPLARDTRNPPEFKTRVAPLCPGCLRDARLRLRGNPQGYNGRGSTVWVLPV
jgi:hypothetical protein